MTTTWPCSSRIQPGKAEITAALSLLRPSSSGILRNAAPVVIRASAVGLRHAGWRDECLRGIGPDAIGASATRAPTACGARTACGTAQATPDPAAPAADAQQAVEEPIGNVATVIGSASVVRNNETTPLRVKDDIYLNDVVQTGAKSALGITFSDATTFNLKANSQITIDSYVYEDGGKQNAGVFDVAKGTVAFVAAAVAKTGDMKITTPTATLGFAAPPASSRCRKGPPPTTRTSRIKLYPDADGRVGRIEVNDRAGARLGFLSQGSSGFTIRPVRRRALCRGAADDFTAANAARPGFCASASLDAKSRPPRLQRAARLPPRQPRLQPCQRAAPRTAAKRIAGTESHRATAGPKPSGSAAAWVAEPSWTTAAAGSTEPSRTTIAEPAGSAATARHALPAGSTIAAAQPGSPQQTGLPPRPGQPPVTAGRPGFATWHARAIRCAFARRWPAALPAGRRFTANAHAASEVRRKAFNNRDSVRACGPVPVPWRIAAKACRYGLRRDCAYPPKAGGKTLFRSWPRACGKDGDASLPSRPPSLPPRTRPA